jgi:hypothetical protein
MPGTQVPTLSGQALLAQDPGVQFRQDQARQALEASAAARGGMLSGPALAALQRQGQDLASQEYGNAWQRMMSRDIEQYGRDWNQYLQNWQQGVTGTQLGLQTQAQNFQQAMSAAQLREQVNQIASQQGWSQAQAEAAFREQMAQQASAQNWQQALQGQQTAWQQGLTGQQWMQEQRRQADQDWQQRMWERLRFQYGADVAQNQTEYDRQLAAWNSQRMTQQDQWNRLAGLSGLGPTATQQLGAGGQTYANSMGNLLQQLGQAQGLGALGPALSWQGALSGAANNMTSVLAGLNR